MSEEAVDSDDDEDSGWEDSIEDSGEAGLEDSVTSKRIPTEAQLNLTAGSNQPAVRRGGTSKGSIASFSSASGYTGASIRAKKPARFALGRSKDGSVANLRSMKPAQTTYTSVTTRTTQPPSDENGSYIDEEAIDGDDDDSDWEGSIEQSRKAGLEDSVISKRTLTQSST